MVCFAGPSGSGKTTLLCRLLPVLRGRGLRVGVIKQARDDFDVDRPGTDSERLRTAGVEDLILSSPGRTARVMEHPRGPAARLDGLLSLLGPGQLDVVLVEGFADAGLPTVAVSRGGAHLPPGPGVIALAREGEPHTHAVPPVLDIDDPETVADFLQTHIARLETSPGGQESNP